MKQKYFSSPALFWGISLSMLMLIGAISHAFAAIHAVQIVDDVTGDQMSINANGDGFDAKPNALLTKAADKSVVNVGEEVTYTIHVQVDDIGLPPPPDDGPSGEVNAAIVYPLLQLTDTLPDPMLMEFVSIDASDNITCQSDAAEIRCQASNVHLFDRFTITSVLRAKNPGTATNTVELRDENDTLLDQQDANVLIQDPGNVFVVSADPDKTHIELGEEVHITTTITNRTPAETLTDITLTDTYPSEILRITNVTSSDTASCSSDSQKVQCHIEALPAGETISIVSTYVATNTGLAVNKMTLESATSKPLSFESSVQVEEADVVSLLLKSSCEGRNLFVGNRCALTVTANYEFAPEQDVSLLATFAGFDGIGTMAENVLTTTQIGEANITATYKGKTSNAIRLVVTDGVNPGQDLEGNIVSHFAARTNGGKDVVEAYNTPITVGTIMAESNVVARNNKITFSDMGVVEILDWFLEDAEFGTIRDANTGGACSPLENGIMCRGKKSILFESKNKKGTVLLRVSDDDGNARNITIHIVSPSVESVEITSINGKTPEETVYFPQEEIHLTSTSTLVDGTVQQNTQDEVEWEFRYNGGEWTSSSEAGRIVRGIFTPKKEGTFVIRAKAVQNMAMPGVNFLTQRNDEVLSQEVSVQIGDATTYIESMRLQGNEGLAKGTSDVLFVRLRNIEGISDIHDMELNLIRGMFSKDEDIPASTQHLSLTVVPKDIHSQKKDSTLLLQIPFFIPEIDDLKNGAHTLQLVIEGNSGLVRDKAEKHIPIFIGEPETGDGNLDGKVNLVDAVIAMRIVEGTDIPSGLQMLSYDINRDEKITLSDVIEIFRTFLLRFLQE